MQSATAFTPRVEYMTLTLRDLPYVPNCSQTPRSIAQSNPSPLHSFTLPPSTYPPPHLLSAHQNLIKLSPPILSPLFNNVAISTLNGLSTSGYASNWCIASSVDVSVYAGDQDVFKRSRQISPDLKSTFGWQIGVLKVILGGARG